MKRSGWSGASLTLSGLALVLLAGCQSHGPDSPTPGRDGAATTAAGSCDYDRSEDEKAGGPLQGQWNGTTWGMNYVRPGTFQDATVIPLENTGDSPLLIDSVDLVPEPKASPITLEEAFVASPTIVETIGRTRPDSKYQRAEGHCLPPLGDDRAPILALRIGPAEPQDVDGWRKSANNSVNVHYRTADGQRYVAAYPFRFEYPNHR